MPKPVQGERKVIMARRVAAKWIQRTARAEYRFDVLATPSDLRQISNMLRAFRDGKVAVRGIPRIPDLGLQEQGDTFAVWSRDRKAILALEKWFEARGFETSGVW
jgi:hypothetical protein